MTPRRKRLALLSAVLTVLASVFVVLQAGASSAAGTPLTVAQAIAGQNGSTATVRGYVVGQPTATTTVVTSNFPNDYALALADAPGQTATGQVLYVQITSTFRSAYGLQSNPDLVGKELDVTGALGAYFSHPGLKSTTAFTITGSSTPTTTTTTSAPGDPGDTDAYYAAALGKTGPELKAALHTIISQMTKLSYDQDWDGIKATDEDPNNPNNVIEIYSGRSVPKSTNGGDPDDWNREHVWAKSHGDFGTATGPGTDLHHLRAEDVTVNSTRSNKDFDNGGSPVDQCSGCLTDSDSFQPRDAVKGDVARMILYMAVRYEGDDGFPDLEPNESTSNNTNPNIGKLSVLLAWNDQDPPDATEMHRNEVIYTQFQHNRNPFIDHPEWARAIYG
ncbi:endonuclease [Labedaea rhizosphaerae]|uniref:Endonuclease I n=1 Tax=Labedaea rhizosphaerae TaxID=598644 RepID=A0A4R6SH32_LABRH|nr:endonuclease I [Labedaea rhizosphaerae]